MRTLPGMTVFAPADPYPLFLNVFHVRTRDGVIRREVLPYTPDAWIKENATKIGYEVSFTRHFYKPQPLRTLEQISADILTAEKETEGFLDGILKVPRK